MKRKNMLCILMILAVVLVLCACGDKGKSAEEPGKTESTAGPGSESIFATPDPGAPVVTATPIPTPEIIMTPEPTKVPINVKLQYEGQDVTALSLQTSAVFQFQAVTSDGSAGGTWTSSDAGTASVDENGVVTCWKSGSARITYTQDNASATCTLTISEPTVRIFQGGQEKRDITLSAQWGFVLSLDAIVTPAGSAVTWSSDDPSIVSVSDSGVVTGLRAGFTTIRAKCGSAEATCIIRVQQNPPAYVAPTPAPDDNTPRIVITWAGVPNYDFTITVGQAVDMDYRLYNIDPGKTVTWSIQDPAYASVDANGVVVGLKSTWGITPFANYTKLIATCGDYKCECIVFVKEATITP